MEKANLPTHFASEPNEEAYQPPISIDPESSTSADRSKKNVNRAFVISKSNDINFSQNSCTTKEALSQPEPKLTHKERLQWLQQRRSQGLWAQCDDCQSWRYLPNVLDSHELPEKWYCSMNSDPVVASCAAPQARLRVRDEEELVHGEYSAGSLVWARAPGWPRWPAMVDDEPDTEQFYWLDGFSDIPTHYNVVFFDNEVTRAWITPENLMSYSGNKKNIIDAKKYKKRIEAAMKQANDAAKLSLAERLAKYSFIARYNGVIGSPRKFDRKVLEKFRKRLQKKFNVPFPIESSSESEDDVPINSHQLQSVKVNDKPKQEKIKASKRKNVTIVGTPKRLKKITPKNILMKEFDESMEVVSNTTKKSADDFDTELVVNAVKEPDSMAVQLCDSQSTTCSSIIRTDGFITSTKTVPETESESLTDDIPDVQTRAWPSTPKSDDFDF